MTLSPDFMKALFDSLQPCCPGACISKNDTSIVPIDTKWEDTPYTQDMRGTALLLLELFLNKTERSSKAQHRCQQHHLQNQLCDCGRHAPKCCSASCRQWHARSRCAHDSRRYWPPCAHRFIAGEGSFGSCEVSSSGCHSDHPCSRIACQDSLNRPAHGYRHTNPTQAETLV